MNPLLDVYLDGVNEGDLYAASQRMVSRRMGTMFMAVEATGSYHAAVSSGVLDDVDPQVLEMFRLTVPLSRGGLARGLEAEQEWESMAREMMNRLGKDVFDNLRAEIEAMQKEIEQAEGE